MQVEVRTCRFVICDLSEQNRGACWDAGFATGIEGPACYLCRLDEFAKKAEGGGPLLRQRPLPDHWPGSCIPGPGDGPADPRHAARAGVHDRRGVGLKRLASLRPADASFSSDLPDRWSGIAVLPAEDEAHFQDGWSFGGC